MLRIAHKALALLIHKICKIVKYCVCGSVFSFAANFQSSTRLTLRKLTKSDIFIMMKDQVWDSLLTPSPRPGSGSDNRNYFIDMENSSGNEQETTPRKVGARNNKTDLAGSRSSSSATDCDIAKVVGNNFVTDDYFKKLVKLQFSLIY